MQLIEILSHSNKIKTVDDLLNHFDAVVELAKDDVYKIAKSKRLNFSDFDFAYGDSVEMLRRQLQKSYLKGISRFLKCENVADAASWLIERLINNMRNITTNRKYKLYCAPDFCNFDENIKSNDELETVLELIELERFDKETIKNGLQAICENSTFDEDFDYLDIEYLCQKFDINIKEITRAVDLVKTNLKIEQTKSGHSQLVFVFES